MVERSASHTTALVGVSWMVSRWQTRFRWPASRMFCSLLLKQSALISVVGLVELMRQAQIGAGSTRKPFTFFLTAGVLYLLISLVSGAAFRAAEARAMRGIRRVS